MNLAYSQPFWYSELLGYEIELFPCLLGHLGLEQIGLEKVSKFTVGVPSQSTISLSEVGYYIYQGKFLLNYN